MKEAEWDAICVGAGITSLAFAAQAICENPETRILIIDKHTSAGGYATLFSRPKAGAYFDCSLHKLSGTRRDGGNLYRIFEKLQLHHELELVAHEDHFDACLPCETIPLANDPLLVEQSLIERFPTEASGIRHFFEELAEHGRAAYYQQQIVDGTVDVDFRRLRFARRHLMTISVAEALAERFTNDYLKEILAAPCIYVGGFPEDLNYLYFLHVVYATLCRGNSYLSGSSQRLSDALAARVVSAGGALQLGTTVLKIIPGQNGALHRIDTTRGTFASRRVFINAAPRHALSELFDELPELEPTKERLARLKPSQSTMTLYLLTDLEPDTLGFDHVETMIFGSPHLKCLESRAAARESAADSAVCEEAYWRVSPMQVTNYHALNPAAGCVLCVNVLDTIGHWPGRKDKAYKAKKQRAATVLLERLIAAKPALTGHVTFGEVATPRTYERYTNNTDGAGYGALAGTDASTLGFHRFFPFGGIDFLSTWVGGSGYEAAFVYAENQAKAWSRDQVANSH